MKIIDLVQGVQDVLPGAPFESVQPLAVAALREFCNRSLWYQVEVTPALVDDQAEYSLSLPSGTESVAIVSARQDGFLLNPAKKPLKESVSNKTQTDYYSSPTIDFGVIPPPENSEPVIVTVAVRPTTLAVTVDDRFSPWDEDITSGTLARLFANPLSGWYSTQLSDFYRVQFKDACRKAANIASSKFIESGKTISMRTLV